MNIKKKSKYSDSEDESDKQRVVLPERQKRIEEINALLKQLKNSKKIRDIVKTNEIFEDLVKSYDKCKKIIESDGHIKSYLMAIADLETFTNELWNDSAWRSSASKINATALTKMRQRIRKYNKDFEQEIANLKSSETAVDEEAGSAASGSETEKPGKEEKESSEEESSDDDENKNEDDDDSEWSESESSDDSSIDYEGEDIWKTFLKKDKDEAKPEKAKKDRVRKSKIVRPVADDEDETEVKVEKPKLFAKDEEINHESVLNKLSQICSGRGRRGTDRKVQLESINELRDICKQYNLSEALDIKILMNQIAIYFDYNPRVNKCMKADTWNHCLSMLEEILDVLFKNANIEVSDAVQDDEENVADGERLYRIKGCVLTIADRMSEEFTRILQQCDAHGSEYVERLKDEPKLCNLIDRLLKYLEQKEDKQQL